MPHIGGGDDDADAGGGVVDDFIGGCGDCGDDLMALGLDASELQEIFGEA
jgi:hypothetical protein